MDQDERTNVRSGIALVSANFGGIDEIKPFLSCAGIDAFYYTDAATLATAAPDVAASWTRIIVPNYPRHDFGARLRGRYFKHQIHRLPETASYRWLVWADTSLLFVDPTFLVEQAQRLASLPPNQRILLVPHPDRRTVREEYTYIRDEISNGNEYLRIRYADEKMTEQIEAFESQGMSIDAQLWCGTIWMVENTALMHRCWDSWWDQNLRYGMMDQLSLPVLLEQFRLEPQALPINLWENRYFRFIHHRILM
jgi:hypothetical protein